MYMEIAKSLNLGDALHSHKVIPNCVSYQINQIKIVIQISMAQNISFIFDSSTNAYIVNYQLILVLDIYKPSY